MMDLELIRIAETLANVGVLAAAVRLLWKMHSRITTLEVKMAYMERMKKWIIS